MDVPAFMELLKKHEFTFFTGVPGTTLTYVVNYLNHNTEDITHVRACNECEAIAISAGYHLGSPSKKTGVVYMQNSGLGKCVNPLTSLTDPHVYSIPILLIIGWRGEPDGELDDPQHIKIGRIMRDLLDVLEIPHTVLPDDELECENVIKTAKEYIDSRLSAYAIIVRRNYFEEYYPQGEVSGSCDSELVGEDAINAVLDQLNEEDVIVANTGRISRRLASVLKDRGVDPELSGKVIYNLGSLGCAAAISFGISIGYNYRVVVLDGDGAVLMQMGSLSTIGAYQPENLYHIIIDNACYASTGTHPSNSLSVDFPKVAKGTNYKWTDLVETYEDLKPKIREFLSKPGPNLLVIRTSEPLSRNLPRLVKPLIYKDAFFKFVNEFREKNG
ncbi:MAG: phosphonopyruvate decarboxylase [Candidatus Lokiarchaeota archaeon]|nr:phosphonopyruvate decarboxylase [Candidatus Lokiarchaeota archaeon]